MRSGTKGQIVSTILGMLDQIDDTTDELSRCQRLADDLGRRIDLLGQQVGRLDQQVGRLEVKA